MRRLVPLVLLVLVFSGLAIASPKIEKQSFTSNDRKRTFYLFVPENVKAAEPAPLLMLLHGSGRNGLSLVEKWKDLAAQEGIILAGLDSLDSSHWSTTGDSPSVLRDLVDLLKSKYPINPRRVYLFGHSAGAVYALDLSMVESEYFAAAAIHAGGFREKAEFEFIDAAQRKIPLAIWIGTKDPFFPLESVRATRDALRARGFPVEMTEMPGHDHWYYDLAPKINEAAWQFLKKYELPTDPRYGQYVEARDASGANKLIEEISKLRDQVTDLINQANLKALEISSKDFAKDRSEIQRLASEEANLLKQGAAMLQAGAEKAERAAQMNIGERNRDYLKAIAQYTRKYAEVLTAKFDEADLLLGNESFEVINSKKTEARKRVEKLQQEADELRQRLEKAMP